MTRILPVVALCLLPLTAAAQDRQYRRLTLIDGRTLTAEILATESTGLRLRLPQGETLVSFEVLLDMVPSEQEAYDNQRDWVVFVLAEKADQDELIGLVDAIPGVGAYTFRDGAGASAGGLTQNQAAQAGQCERDMACIISVVAETPTKSIVTGSRVDGQLVLQSKVNTSGSPPETVKAASLERDDLWKAAHESLGLEPPRGAAPRPGSDAGNTGGGATAGWTERRVLTSSFVPVPGYPSLAQGDASGVALALGVVVPTTALWVGAVGQSGQSAGEFAALSVAGFYASTVLANQVVGLRSLKKTAVVVSPSVDGRGGTVQVGGAW